MPKKRIFLLISLFGILIISFFGFLNFLKKNQNSEDKGLGVYFCDIPLSGWTDTEGPCIMIQIGEKKISSLLDLGFTGLLSLNSDVLSQIEKKSYLRTTKRYGYNGKEFEKRVFEIPEIKINEAYVSDAHVLETAMDFHDNSKIYSESGTFLPEEPGSIGWQLFQIFNLFLDLGKEKIIFSDSIETLQHHGYFNESFAKTPLIHDRGLVEIDVEVSNGTMRCVLDTGFTRSSLNTPYEEGKKFDIKNRQQFNQFKIATQNFGPVDFLRLPIELPIHVEAILGMDFFKENMIFLDFTNDVAYFAPSVKKMD